MRRHLLGAAVLLCLLPALAAARGDILEQMLVKVNGDIITKTDLEQRQIAALRQENPNFRPGSDAELRKALVRGHPGGDRRRGRRAADGAEGQRAGLHPGHRAVPNIVENIKKENKIETDEAFQAALKQEGMTMDDLRRQLERNDAGQHACSRSRSWARSRSPEEEVKKYYEAHPDKFTTAPQLTLREILIAVPDQRQGHQRRAKTTRRRPRPRTLRKRLLAGEPFAHAGVGAFGFGIKGQRRPRRPAQPTICPPTAQGDRAAQDRRRHAGAAHRARLSDHQDRRRPPPPRFRPSTRRVPTSPTRSPTPSARRDARSTCSKLRAQAIIDWKNDEVKKAYEVGVKQQEPKPPRRS